MASKKSVTMARKDRAALADYRDLFNHQPFDGVWGGITDTEVAHVCKSDDEYLQILVRETGREITTLMYYLIGIYYFRKEKPDAKAGQIRSWLLEIASEPYGYELSPSTKAVIDKFYKWIQEYDAEKKSTAKYAARPTAKNAKRQAAKPAKKAA
jgi:hypothetical protein